MNNEQIELLAEILKDTKSKISLKEKKKTSKVLKVFEWSISLELIFLSVVYFNHGNYAALTAVVSCLLFLFMFMAAESLSNKNYNFLLESQAGWNETLIGFGESAILTQKLMKLLEIEKEIVKSKNSEIAALLSEVDVLKKNQKIVSRKLSTIKKPL